MDQEKEIVDFSKLNFARLGHNYFMQTRGGSYHVDDLNLLNGYVNFLLRKEQGSLPSHKVAIMLIAINAPYWRYIPDVVQGIRNLFLPGHEVEILLFSDIPEVKNKKSFVDSCPTEQQLQENPSILEQNRFVVSKEYANDVIDKVRGLNLTIFPVDSVGWPYPTLMRFHLMLQQEEYLNKFEYIFFLDIDMRVVNVVGDEILGDGLTGAQHPMYALRKEFWPPYEPSVSSAAYIQRPGKVVNDEGRPRFMPLYYAGGFQGGKTELFLKAMKKMKKQIDEDLARNYIAIWNDESHWNKYLSDNPPAVVLSPAYVYPDSMINEYYVKLWGQDYSPKIVTLTKPFTTSKEGGDAARKMTQTL